MNLLINGLLPSTGSVTLKLVVHLKVEVQFSNNLNLDTSFVRSLIRESILKSSMICKEICNFAIMVSVSPYKSLGDHVTG